MEVEFTEAERLAMLVEELRVRRDEAGRSEDARKLAVAITHLETGLLWLKHAGLR